ncbi:hypothetical protein [Paraburkholderia sp. ZP32-5]|jgi:hypothetical protein|nr:hypothetical protein [Paraburkholderia sp. ZP32-5]
MQANSQPIHAPTAQSAATAPSSPAPSVRTVAVSLLVDRVLGA